MRWGVIVVVLALTPATGAAKPSSHDVNGDGLADVVVTQYRDSIDSHYATVIFGSRDRAATVSATKPGARGFRINAQYVGIETAEIMGDANGDGLADIFTDQDGSMSIVYGKRGTAPVDVDHIARHHAGRALPGDGEISHGAGDVNGDGRADVIHSIGDNRTIARVLLGPRARPRHSFRVLGAGRIRVGIRGQVGAAGDLNGDGIGDVALAFEDPDGRVEGLDVEELVVVVFGRRRIGDVVVTQVGHETPRVTAAGCRQACRAAGFAVRPRDCICEVSSFTALGDVGGDPRNDLGILWQRFDGRGGDRVDVLFGPGRGGATIENTTFVTSPVAAGDLTGDDQPDLLVPNDNETQLRVLSHGRLRGRVDAAADTAPAVRGPGITNVVRAGDFDGDGHPDVLLVWGGGENDFWTVVYGASPLAPFDLRSPGSSATPVG
jgi:hypothetical protein